ncbi:MAG: MFS transporter [Acidimicrobiia bacterium]|nr:MFS transporter [Acidimicrobiia bacterium]
MVRRPKGLPRSEQLAIIIAVGGFGTLGFALTSPILPDLAAALDVPPSAIGLVQGSVALPGILFSLVIGYLADRLGRRRVVVASTLIFSTFGLASFWATSFWMLVGLRFLQGIGISGMLGLGIALVGDLFEGPERTKAVGYNLAGIQFMSMLGPIISGLIATGGTFRPFLLFGLGFPLALWATRLAIPRHSSTTRSPLLHVRDMIADMRARNTVTDYLGVLTAALLAVVVYHGVILTATPLFLESEFGVAVQGRGAIVAFFQGGLVVAALAFSRVGGRLGVRAVTLGFFMMALGLTLISTTSSVAQTALGLVVAGSGFGTFMSLGQVFAAGAASAAYRGLAVSMLVATIRLAQTVGPPAASLATDRISSRSAFIGTAALVALLALTWRPVRASVAKRR